MKYLPDELNGSEGKSRDPVVLVTACPFMREIEDDE